MLVLLPTTDSDGDGMPDWQEYLAGTDPHNAASLLKVRLLDGSDGGALIRFTSMANIGYTIQYCTNLPDGPWLNFTNVPPGTGKEEEVLDPNAGAGRSRFYRIVTPVQP